MDAVNYEHIHTMRAAVNAAKQQYQLNPIQTALPAHRYSVTNDLMLMDNHPARKPAPEPESKPVERLPLGTAVVLANGVDAVVSGHSTADCNRYRVSWFNRQIWQAQHKWIERGSLQGVYLLNETAFA